MNSATPKRKVESKRPVMLWLFVAVLMTALGFAAAAAFPETAGQQVRRHLLSKLRAHYSNLYVQIGTVRYEHGTGVIINDLQICDSFLSSQSTVHVKFDRIIAHTSLSLDRLSKLDFSAKRVSIRGVSVRGTIDDRAQSNLMSLLPLPKLGPGADTIEFSDVSVRLTDTSGSGQREITLRDLHGQYHRSPNDKSHQRIYVTGASNIVERIAVSGDLRGEHWTVKTRFSEAEFDERLSVKLPNCMCEKLSIAEGLSITSSGSAAIRGQGTKIDDFAVWLSIDGGHYDTRKIPIRIDELRGELRIDSAGTTIQDLSALVGDARCKVSGQVHGWNEQADATLHIDATEFLIDRAIAEYEYPEPLKKVFRKLQPRGKISVAADVAFKQGQWDWNCNLSCLGLDVQFDKFPYPVRDVRGQVHITRKKTITQGLKGSLAGRTVTCDVTLAKPGVLPDDVTSLVTISSEQMIPIDESLIRALTERDQERSALEKFVRSLNPSGQVGVEESRFQRHADGRTSKFIDLNFERGNINYDRFAYPVHEVRGRIVVLDNLVKIIGLQGRSNGSSVIRANGLWTKHDSGSELQLTLDGFGIPMDRSLRGALSEQHRAVWDQIGPSGVLQHLNVQLQTRPENPVPEIELTASQFQSDDLAKRFVSITPPSFPYQLDITRGQAHLKGNRIEIRDLEAWHGYSRLSAAGNCTQDDAGRWTLSTTILPPTRLQVNDDFLNALPLQVQGTFRSLELRGPPISLRGTSVFAFPNQQNATLDLDWDVQMQLEGNRIGDDGPVRDICGELRLAGEHVAGKTNANGYVRFDSLHAYDFHVSAIQGPIVIENNRLLFGQSISNNSGQSFQSVRGQIFGGLAESDGVMDLTTSQFDVNMRFDKLDFPTLLRDAGGAGEESSGTCRSVMRLKGLLGNSRTLSGQGKAWLEDATLYELPLLVRMLNLLSIQEDQLANKSNSEFQFRIDGEQIHFDDIRIVGDVLVLRGKGTANTRQELNLRFETGVSPNNIWSQLLSPLRDQKYSLWTIDVGGTLSDPILDKRAMKQIEQALERLFPEFEDTAPKRVGKKSSRLDLIR